MPCYDDRADQENKSNAKLVPLLREKLDKATAALCSMCQEVEKEHPEFLQRRPALLEWWTKHKAFDKQRKAHENAARSETAPHQP